MKLSKLVSKDQINIVIGQLSRFDPELKNGDIENCPKITRLWKIKILMFNMMRSGFYEFGMKEKNPIKTLNLLFK